MARTINQKIRLNIIEKTEQGKADAVNKSQLVRAIESGKIYTLTKSMLEILCMEYDIPKTGNKNDLIHRLRDYSENGGTYYNKSLTKDGNRVSCYPSVYGYIMPDDLLTINEGQDFIANWIAKYQCHVPVVIGCIRQIANSDYHINGKEACMQIRDNGFQEEIFEDIKQECYIAVLSDVRYGCAWLLEGKLVLKSVSSVYDAIYRVLKSYKQTSDDLKKQGTLIIGTDKDGNEHYINNVRSDNKAVVMLGKYASIEAIMDTVEYNEFMDYIHLTEHKSIADNLECFILCRFAGMTIKQTAEHMNISRKTAERYSIRVKMIWLLFTDNTVRGCADNSEYGIRSYGHSSAKDSYNFSYGDILTGYQDMNKEAQKPIRGTMSADDIRASKPDVKAYWKDGSKDLTDKYKVVNEPRKQRKYDDITVTARYTRTSAEKRNRTLKDTYPEYFRKHPQELLNPSAFPEKI